MICKICGLEVKGKAAGMHVVNHKRDEYKKIISKKRTYKKIKIYRRCKHCKKYFYKIHKNCEIIKKKKLPIYCGRKCANKAISIQRKHKQLQINEKISNGLKLAFEEGRNLGWLSRHNKSYPEKYVEECFRNNGITNYVYNKKIGRFFGDFVFESKKIVIEIDGGQHDLPEAIDYDKKRDEYIRSQGYEVYRFKWRTLKHNKKQVTKLISLVQ